MHFCSGNVLFSPFCRSGNFPSSCLSWLVIVAIGLALAWMAAWTESCWRAGPPGLLHLVFLLLGYWSSVYVLTLLMILGSGLLLTSGMLRIWPWKLGITPVFGLTVAGKIVPGTALRLLVLVCIFLP